MQVVQDAVEGRDPGPLLRRKREEIEMCEAVLQAWRDRLGHEVEDLLDQVDDEETE